MTFIVLLWAPAARVWPASTVPSTVFSGRGKGSFPAGNAAEDNDPGQAMQSESTSRLAGGIKSWYDLAMNIEYLAFAVDPEASEAIVQDGRRPGGVKRRRLDLVFRRRLSEV